MVGKRTYRTEAALALGVAGALLLAGCAEAPGGGSGAAATSDFRACAVSGAGGWQDKSFNEQVYLGLVAAGENLGIEVLPFESQTSDDFAPGLDTLAEQDCNLIFSVGFDANGAVNAAAASNPNIDYVTVDGYVEDEATTNLKPVAYLMDQSSFLGGYVAAAHSTTHVIATFGAIQNSAITDFMTGFYFGAQQWATDNATPTTVLGWNPADETGAFVGGFDDQIAAKSIAVGQLDQHADVLFPVAGPLFAGAAEAIRDAGTDAVFVGVDSDVAVTSPQYADFVLASVEKRMQTAVEEIIEQAVAGNFDSTAYRGDLGNAGTGLSPFHEFDSAVPDALKARLGELSASIISGQLSTTN